MNIQRKVLTRLLLVWLLLSAAGGGGVFYLEMERVDRLVVKLALAESEALVADFLDYSRRPDGARLDALRRRCAEGVRGRFVVVELYDADKRLVVQAAADGHDAVLRAAHGRVHRFPPGPRPEYRKFLAEGRLLLHVIAPLRAGGERPVGYLEGVYRVDAATLADIERDVSGTLALVLAVVLGTTVILYPVILALDRELIRFASDLLEANLQLMDVLGSAISQRDSDTGSHNYRVTLYALRLAEALALDGDRMRDLIAGAFLHDVGKIGVRDDVLLKPGGLSGEELERMRTHVARGVSIVSKARWLRGASAVVEAHHEKFDGSGYPHGLAGESIPLIARIFAIADVFDALTSRRPYKDPFPLEDALKTMAGKRGSHFDPRLLDAFLAIAPSLHREAAGATDAEVEALVGRLAREHFGAAGKVAGRLP